MKIQLLLAAVSAALLTASSTFPVCAESTDRLPEEWETVTSGDNFSSFSDTSEQEPPVCETEEADKTVPNEAPAFDPYIEYSPEGFVVKGTFTEFLPETSLVRPLYSLDGEVWQFCQVTWDADDLKWLQNQTYFNCLYSNHEPLTSYLAGQLDRFYLKLQITLENGITYETQAAVIDRGSPQPIPEELHPVATFIPDMLVRQWKPFKCYGQYQITVNADATPEDISALLPDTLPIEIQLYAGIDIATYASVDCPVTWKTLSLPPLTTGESVTIADAAQEIIVPAGTLLNTPGGIFQLNEPLGIDHGGIQLVLNVVAENAAPSGVLACDIDGLQIAFHLKPTGATAIRAYILSEAGGDWVELPDPLLPEEFNAPSSIASSAYTLVLRNTSEPYRTYLDAWNKGAEPAPFFVGLEIEGGVYDGRQLILAWPDTYELPAKLPDLKGSGGNECNAGSDNKNDSTLEGQRPNLPQNPESLQIPPEKSESLQMPSEKSELSQSPEYKPDAQQPSPYIPETWPEPLRPLEDETNERTAGKDNSFLQIPIAETLPSLTAGAGNPTLVPAVSAETNSPSEGITVPGTKHSLYRLLLLAAAITAMGGCITAYRFLHRK